MFGSTSAAESAQATHTEGVVYTTHCVEQCLTRCDVTNYYIISHTIFTLFGRNGAQPAYVMTAISLSLNHCEGIFSNTNKHVFALLALGKHKHIFVDYSILHDRQILAHLIRFPMGDAQVHRGCIDCS